VVGYQWPKEYVGIIDTIVSVIVMLVIIDIMYNQWKQHRNGVRVGLFSFAICFVSSSLCILKLLNLYFIKSGLIAWLLTSHNLVFLMILCVILHRCNTHFEQCG